MCDPMYGAASREPVCDSLRVLIACEFSGRVRDAFAALGHDATSCDLLPSETAGKHYQGDVRDILGDGWDLMIAHPPCTYLSYAGMAWWNRPGRAELREQAMQFFMLLYNAPIERVCVENPFGYPCQAAGAPTQIIEPYAFGHPERKRTCLWLRNLPKLKATNLVEPEQEYFRDKTTGKKRHFVDHLSPSPDRWKDRSRTFPGIAAAMAQQWGGQA